jgi:hypothetical protein
MLSFRILVALLHTMNCKITCQIRYAGFAVCFQKRVFQRLFVCLNVFLGVSFEAYKGPWTKGMKPEAKSKKIFVVE